MQPEAPRRGTHRLASLQAELDRDLEPHHGVLIELEHLKRRHQPVSGVVLRPKPLDNGLVRGTSPLVQQQNGLARPAAPSHQIPREHAEYACRRGEKEISQYLMVFSLFYGLLETISDKSMIMYDDTSMNIAGYAT